MYYFFLTIDKVKLDKKPTKVDIVDTLLTIMSICDLHHVKPYPIRCFEYKDKGKKYGNWLHYHCILSSIRQYIPYKDSKVECWSIKLEKLKTMDDLARVAGYISKHKIDNVNIVHNKDIRYYHTE